MKRGEEENGYSLGFIFLFFSPVYLEVFPTYVQLITATKTTTKSPGITFLSNCCIKDITTEIINDLETKNNEY